MKDIVSPMTSSRLSAGTNLSGSEDVLDGLGDLGTNAITLDQADEVVALVEIVSLAGLMRAQCRSESVVVLSDFSQVNLAIDPMIRPNSTTQFDDIAAGENIPVHPWYPRTWRHAQRSRIFAGPVVMISCWTGMAD
jgi:hypothetical protein